MRLFPVGVPLTVGFLLICCLQIAISARQGSLDAVISHRDGAKRVISTVNQCFPWSMEHSIAREDFDFVDAATLERRSAKKGDLIKLRCDGIVCPNPKVDDCYMDESVCGSDEWCMLQDQMRFGPWAMANGETPNVPVGGDGRLDCKYYRENGLDYLYNTVCQGRDDWGPWSAVRGRCVPYRKEQQSCNAYLGETAGDTMHHYVIRSQDGRPPLRPMVCGPGLVCTGDEEPVPFTCVPARPPNACFQGPWWDSTWCKVDSGIPEHTRQAELERARTLINPALVLPRRFQKDWPAGLPRKVLEHVAQALLIQLPVEKYHSPLNPGFWNDPAADKARRLIQNIVESLWPVPYRKKTTFPLAIPDPREAGPLHSAAWNATAEVAAQVLHQSSKVWSTIHSLIHNMPDPMPASAVRASRALAVWLRQHFMCQNCRGFWGNDVLNNVGLPPDVTAREQHKRWWWRAHNMVSEHTAATRGGHPWVWLGAGSEDEFAAEGAKYNKELLKCQNPWFVPFDAVCDMWLISEEVERME